MSKQETLTINIRTKRLTAHTLHRWLMLLLAVPILIWTVTGSYFVLFDIGFIRSDHITPATQKTLPVASFSVSKGITVTGATEKYPIAQVYQRYPKAQQIHLIHVAGQWVYQVMLTDEKLRIDAQTGKQLPPLTQQQAELVATAHQHQQSIPSSASIQITQLITDKTSDNMPTELSSRHLPVWQVMFDDTARTTLYISSGSGEVVTRRHEYWRWFDLFWKWHIMDYDDGADVDNKLLLLTTLLALVATVSGGLLIWQRRKRYC
ncbi:peptidase [Shewanella maritima]|uniref:peptidase n=1 Tax=Shewanella maritima TaxID=2520507 RepID=UPI0037366EAC